jgi:hypothetical protein
VTVTSPCHCVFIHLVFIISELPQDPIRIKESQEIQQRDRGDACCSPCHQNLLCASFVRLFWKKNHFTPLVVTTQDRFACVGVCINCRNLETAWLIFFNHV